MSLVERLRRLHAEGHAREIEHRDETGFAGTELRSAAVLRSYLCRAFKLAYGASRNPNTPPAQALAMTAWAKFFAIRSAASWC